MANASMKMWLIRVFLPISLMIVSSLTSHPNLPSRPLTCDEKEWVANDSCKWAYDECLLDLNQLVMCRFSEIEEALMLLQNSSSGDNGGMEPNATQCSCTEEIERLDALIEPLILQSSCQSSGGVFCMKHSKCYTDMALREAQNYTEAAADCNGSSNLWEKPDTVDVILDCFSNDQTDGTYFSQSASMPSGPQCPGFIVVNSEFTTETSVPCDNSETTFYACEIVV